MFTLNDQEIGFIELVLEGFLYGFYSGIYAMYLQYHWQASKKDTAKKQNIVFYSICILYILSAQAVLFAADITRAVYHLLSKPMVSGLRIYFIETTVFGCCDFIAQFILIYRCWIVWGCNIRVVIIPSALAFAFLVTWLAGGSSVYISSGELVSSFWGYPMTLSALALSLTVNSLVTGLIVFRILKVFRQVGATSNDQILGATGGSKLRRTILILVESGMALFSIQLARVVVTIVDMDAQVTSLAFAIIVVIHEMLTGITPTIILVRTSMGFSFHDEKSMEDVAIGSLRFASNYSNSVQETRSIDIASRDRRDDYIGVERSNNIDIVEMKIESTDRTMPKSLLYFIETSSLRTTPHWI